MEVKLDNNVFIPIPPLLRGGKWGGNQGVTISKVNTPPNPLLIEGEQIIYYYLINIIVIKYYFLYSSAITLLSGGAASINLLIINNFARGLVGFSFLSTLGILNEVKNPINHPNFPSLLRRGQREGVFFIPLCSIQNVKTDFSHILFYRN
jgi:hypothetical protein